jgi:hypothetical protein
MLRVPRDSPAQINRRLPCETGDQCITVASGPLLIMAHGLMAIEADVREDMWITSQGRDFTPQQAAEALSAWLKPPAQHTAN